jgi:hypothetical protein
MGISIKWDAGSRFRKWAHCAGSGRDLHLPSAPDWVEQAWGWTWGRGRNDNFRCSSPQCLPFRVPSASQPGLLRGGVTSDTSAWWVEVWGRLRRGCPVSWGTKRLFLRILSVDHWLTRCRASLPRCSLRRRRRFSAVDSGSRPSLRGVQGRSRSREWLLEPRGSTALSPFDLRRWQEWHHVHVGTKISCFTRMFSSPFRQKYFDFFKSHKG